MFRACKRMRGKPVNGAGDMRIDIAKHGTFGRSGIGQDGTGFHRWHNLCGKVAKSTDRHRHDYKIGILYGGHSIGRHMIDKPELFDFGCLARINLAAGDVAGEPRTPCGKGNRGADQTDADNGYLVINDGHDTLLVCLAVAGNDANHPRTVFCSAIMAPYNQFQFRSTGAVTRHQRAFLGHRISRLAPDHPDRHQRRAGNGRRTGNNMESRLIKQPAGHFGLIASRHKRNIRTFFHRLSHQSQIITANSREETAEMPAGDSHGVAMDGNGHAVILQRGAGGHKLAPQIDDKPGGKIGGGGDQAVHHLSLTSRAIGSAAILCCNHVGSQHHPAPHKRKNFIIQLIDGLAQLAEFIGHRARNRQVQNKSASGQMP